jgi:hypothetical protein
MSPRRLAVRPAVRRDMYDRRLSSDRCPFRDKHLGPVHQQDPANEFPGTGRRLPLFADGTNSGGRMNE